MFTDKQRSVDRMEEAYAYYRRRGLVDATFRKHTALGRKLAIEITIGDAIACTSYLVACS